MDLIRLERGGTRCVVVPEAGGRMHQLEIFDGRDWIRLLLAPDDPCDALSAPLMSGSYAMAPWPNRIAGGVFEFEGRRYRLPQNHHGHAIHGFGFERAWHVESQSADACRLSIDFGDAWPLGGRAEQAIEVHEDAIVQRIELYATAGAYPAGAGWHPWFRRDVRGDAGLRVLVSSVETYETVDEIPTGRLLPVAGHADLRHGPAIGDRRLDTCYREVDGAMRICWGAIELTMEQSPNARHAVVYTPPDAFCVEPQTCVIDAFNLAARGYAGTGMTVVTPNDPLVATTIWRWQIDGSRRGLAQRG